MTGGLFAEFQADLLKNDRSPLTIIVLELQRERAR